jgi:hypothetical protein
VTGWLIATLTALAVLLLGMVKADLEDAKVCRWLARRLIYRAALRLPRGERARWREEMIRDVLDLLPGRLPPLLWALDIYVKSGGWGRMRGAPSRWHVLLARTRAAWQRLRTLPQTREAKRLEGEKALSRQVVARQLHPSAWAQAEPRRTLLLGTVGAGKTESLLWGSSYQRWVSSRQQDDMAHLSDEEFTAWLAQQRRDFEDKIDRGVDEYRRRRPPWLPG